MSFIARNIYPLVLEALTSSRVVCLLGARQVGKTSLALHLAEHDYPATTYSLDRKQTLESALRDPDVFINDLDGPVLIDEIQRAPELLLAIKDRVDRNPATGQFLLTGSANLLTLPMVADSLPGRVTYATLWPFTQGELYGTREQFIDRLFAGEPPHLTGLQPGIRPHTDALITGGYPLAQGNKGRALSQFFAGYLRSMLRREELEQIASLRHYGDLEQLLRLVAMRSGAIANFSSLSNKIGLTSKTVQSYTKVLSDLFLVYWLRPWRANLSQRELKAPKLYLTDSGLLAHLTGVNEQRLTQLEYDAGTLVETFTVTELLRQSEWATEEVRPFYYRDQYDREVDLILERNSGELVAIEVKSGSVRKEDFRHLEFLRNRAGKRFRAGVVLHLGRDTLPYGDRLWSVPLSGLWES